MGEAGEEGRGSRILLPSRGDREVPSGERWRDGRQAWKVWGGRQNRQAGRWQAECRTKPPQILCKACVCKGKATKGHKAKNMPMPRARWAACLIHAQMQVLSVCPKLLFMLERELRGSIMRGRRSPLPGWR